LIQDIRVWTTKSSTIAQTDAATVGTETLTTDNMGSIARRKYSEYKQGLAAYIVPTEDTWTIIMTATFCLLVCKADNRSQNRCKPIFETPYITSCFLLHTHTMLDSHQTCMDLANGQSKLCAGKKRKHYECEHMELRCTDSETKQIDANNYWTDLSGKGKVHKFFVYAEVVDEHNRDNVFSTYVDSTLSIKSLKNKILIHENKDLKTPIRLRIKIDKGSSMRKRVDLSYETKHTKSFQDVMTKFDTAAFLLDANMMFRVVINWSIRL